MAHPLPYRAPRAPQRLWRLLVTWVVVFSCFSLFASVIVTNAAGNRTDYAGAIKKLTAGRPLAPNEALIVVNSGNPGGSIANIFSSVDWRLVCRVRKAQLPLLRAHYVIGQRKVIFHKRPLKLITVAGAHEAKLRQLLGLRHSSCQMVQRKSLFYLPFETQTS